MNFNYLRDYPNLKLNINGNRDYVFSNKILFDFHSTNFSKIVINDVLPLENLNGKHFSTDNIFIDNFSLVQLEAWNPDNTSFQVLFIGIVNATGRLSLKPLTLKSQSLEIVDLRIWLSKKSPVDLKFRNIAPLNALNEFMAALGESRLALGKVNFTISENITAYDTTNKSPYSILKDVIAAQTNSFLYFSFDEMNHKLLINFSNERELQSNPLIFDYFNDDEINRQFGEYKIRDINFQSDTDQYVNTLRYESENTISNQSRQELLSLGNQTNNYTLDYKIGKVITDPEKTYFYDERNREKQALIIVNKKVYEVGQTYHLLYEKNSDKLEFDPDWDRNNVFINFNYFPKVATQFTINNHKEVQRIANLTEFKGDVFKFEKYNDYSNPNDLLRKAKGELNFKSTNQKELKIKADEFFINIGSMLEIRHPNKHFNGFYLCIGYNGYLKNVGNSFVYEFEYHLRQGLNSDTVLNYYDNQAFRDNALDEEEIDEINKYVNINKHYYIVEDFWVKKLEVDIIKDKSGLFPAKLPLLNISKNTYRPIGYFFQSDDNHYVLDNDEIDNENVYVNVEYRNKRW